MKPGIHPQYVETTVTCACGNTFVTGSTKPSLRTDLCNVCHPFYTGEQRIVDTAGQVERFLRRVEAAAGSSRPSKRQSRLSARAEREAASRRGPETEEAAPDVTDDTVGATSGDSGDTA
jgi:large subunit ribosomal protein L31